MHAIEQKIIDYVDDNAAELIEFCSKLIQFNSENPPGNSRPISEYIEEFLAEDHIPVTWYEAAQDMWNLTASIGNDSGKTLIYCGHTDVVPAGDLSRWDFDPFSGEVKDGWILGRGASDMKGGLAGLIYAFHVLKQLDIPLDGKLMLAVVPDEETGGELGVPWLLERGLIQGDGCLIAEPSSPLNPTIGQKGSCWFRLTVLGAQAHGSLAPLAGKNAIVDAIRAIEEIKKLWEIDIALPDEVKSLVEISKKYMADTANGDYRDVLDRISVNIGTIDGGTKSNVVPDKCVVEVDCRLPFGITNTEAFALIKEKLDGLAINYEIETFGFKSSANYTPASDPVCEAIIDSITTVTNEHAFGVMQWASSDARHFRDYNIPVLQYGPAYLPSIHNFNEKVLVEDVIRCAKVYALAALKFLNEAK